MHFQWSKRSGVRVEKLLSKHKKRLGPKVGCGGIAGAADSQLTDVVFARLIAVDSDYSAAAFIASGLRHWWRRSASFFFAFSRCASFTWP